MALGCCLWVLWICSLLFDDSAGLPTIREYRYPHKTDVRNIGDDGEDEAFNALSFDDWQASSNQPTDHVQASYSKPSVADEPGSVPTEHNLPNKPSAPAERLVNSESRNWALGNSGIPLIFPLRPNILPVAPAKPQNAPLKTGAGLGAASSHTPLHFNSWQPETVSGGYNPPQLIFEEVFEYPENANPSSSGGASSTEDPASSTGYAPYPSYPANSGAWPVDPPRHGSASSGGENLNPGPADSGYQPPSEHTSLQSPQNVVLQRVSAPINPLPPPSSYIEQYRHGYHRARQFLTKSAYAPEIPVPMPPRLPRVKPAKSPPSSPKGAKSPQRSR